MVSIGSRNLSVTVQGEGSPLVLLETGLGVDASAWGPVADAVSRFARACFYERAGRGGSDADPIGPRGPDVLVDDVHRLLQTIGGTPCVFVGQSFGGLIGRLLARRHPADVAALVLVDSMHEDQFDRCAPLFPTPAEGEPPALSGMRGFWSGGWRDPAQNKEAIDLPACLAAARAIPSLGDLPLHVLTASTFVHPPLFPRESAVQLQAMWEELQGRFTRLSSQATHQFVPECGHFMQVDNPGVVAEAIERMVVRVRGAS